MEASRKHSRKRDAILECLRSTRSHPTAEWVYSRLKPAIPDLSLATVYRNLAQLKEDGIILSVGVFDGMERFDGFTHRHGHFYCTDCGAILDFDTEELPAAYSESVRQQTGGSVTGYSLVYYGLCPECQKKSKNNN